jgi:hypothetical protein
MPMSANRHDQFLPDLEWRGLLHQTTSEDLRGELAIYRFRRADAPRRKSA